MRRIFLSGRPSFKKEILSDFKPEDTRMRLDELHKIEHEADMKKHELSDRLTKAFITPIEREDIAALSEADRRSHR